MNGKRYKVLLVFVSIIASLFIRVNSGDDKTASILGGALALIIGPYIFASLIRYGIKISKWNFNFDDKSFLKSYIILWCIYVALYLFGSFA